LHFLITVPDNHKKYDTVNAYQTLMSLVGI